LPVNFKNYLLIQVKRKAAMIKSLTVTLFPLVFLIVLFGGGALFQRKNIDMDGEPPIGRKLFYISKYLILILWGAMLLHIWGINLSIIEVPGFLQRGSLCLWAAGFTLLLIGRFGLGNSFRIGSPKESTSLRVNGLFKLSRNPMYLGVYATLLAPVLYTLNPILFLAGLFVVVVHHRIVLAEERHLSKVFGEEYANYCNRVRRYL
jgi:protein-S-isoprenylcysteine O-methyltransferase Ste14